MGTINYHSNNDFVSLGYNLSIDDEYEIINDCYVQAKEALKRYDFSALDVDVEGGYYEGFYIKVEIAVLWFYTKEERTEALKEIERLRMFLEECVFDYNVVVCYPGWCTGYEDKKTSWALIEEDLKELKKKLEQVEAF